MLIARTLFAGITLFAATLLGAGIPRADEASACSCGPNCAEIVPNADIIIEGRILGWEQAPEYERAGTFMPIRLALDIERVFKGAVPADFAVADGASLEVWGEDGAEYHWYGSSGACGSFDEDPTGLYIIAALSRDERGYFRMNRLANVFIGYEPGGVYYDSAVAYLTSEVGPPATGTGGPGVSVPDTNDSRAAVLGALLATAGVALFLATTRNTEASG